MATAQTIDIEAILKPIADDNPAGGSLRYSETEREIEKARTADDNFEKGVWTPTDLKVADWGRVVRLATDALATKGKDLQITIRLVEALVKLHGFPGLRDSLCLLRELQEKFWSSLHPLAEDGDYESRTIQFNFLNSERILPYAIRSTGLTTPLLANAERYSFLHWRESRDMDQLARRNADAYAAAKTDGKIIGEDFDKAVAATPRAFYETCLEDLTACREEYKLLAEITDKNFGQDAPSLLNIKSAIEDCYTLVERIVKEKRKLEPDASSLEDEQSGPVIPTSGSSPDEGPIDPKDERKQSDGDNVRKQGMHDRESALRRLEEVAQYFRQAEPHSPVSYLVQRAVHWGRMPLEVWLKEVLEGNTGALGQIWQALGLPKDTEESN